MNGADAGWNEGHASDSQTDVSPGKTPERYGLRRKMRDRKLKQIDVRWRCGAAACERWGQVCVAEVRGQGIEREKGKIASWGRSVTFVFAVELDGQEGQRV